MTVECLEVNTKLLRKMGCWPKWDSQEISEKKYIGYCVAIISSSCLYIAIHVYGMTIYSAEWDASSASEDLYVLLSGRPNIY